MKQCNQCKATFDDAQQLCPACGCADATVIEEANAQPQETQTEQIPTETPYPPYDPNLDIPTPEQNNGNGNILAGVVGAFLFSIIGGILYFIVYQAGFVAGICGLVMFVLANFGYKLFAQTKNKASIPGLIASIAAMVVMIFIAEYACIAYIIYESFKDYGATLFEAIRATPEFLKDPEILSSVLGDLAFSYIFGLLASISNIMEIVKSKKAQKQNPYIQQ